MKNLSTVIEIKYFPFFLSGKNAKKKLSNINNIYKQDLVLGVLSPEKAKVLRKNDVLEKFLSHSEMANEKMYEVYGDILKKNSDLDELEEFEFKNETSDPEDLGLFIEDSPQDNDLATIRVGSLFVDGIEHLCGFLESKSLLEKEMYNYNSPDINQITYILAPIRLSNSEDAKYIQATLDLYPNGFAMIKTFELYDNQPELYNSNEIENTRQSLQILETFDNYSHIHEKYTYTDSESNVLYDVIINDYIGHLFNDLNLEYILDYSVEVTLLLKDSQEKLNLDEKEQLYRIANRPIQSSMKIKSEKIEDLYENNFEIGNSRIWSSSKGHVVVISNQIIQDGDKFDDYSKFVNIEPAIDFPLKVNILSRLNNIYLFYKSSQEDNLIENIRENFLENRLFISLLSENFYGSAKDLELFLKNNMKWYLNEKEFSSRNTDLQMIVDNQKIKTEKKTSKYIEVITLLFTIMFGLPAVKEILETIIIVIYPDIQIDEIIIARVSLLIISIIIILGILFIIRDYLKKIISKSINKVINKYYNSKIIKFK